MPVAPNVILDRAFKFRGLSRGTIQKLSLKIEIDLKAKGFTAKNTQRRSQSSDNLPSPKAVQAIQAVSETLTYKQVRRRHLFIYSALPPRPHCLLTRGH